MKKTRRQVAREKATIGIYQNILVDSSKEEIIEFLNEDKTLMESEESMEFSLWLIDITLQNKESYIKLLSQYLKESWTFERLSVMERAILLIATCELLESDLPKTVIINEAILNTKRFCDDDSYKFINGILSQIV